MSTIRSLWQPAPRRIAVFRALNLGDLLCSMPALRTLRRYAAQAHITLIGLESERAVVARFSDYIDELVLFPGDPAFPEQPTKADALPQFYRDMQARHFDLALQLHGSGVQSNAIVSALGAKQWAGFVPQRDAEEPGRFMAWPDNQHEIDRYLSLMAYLGLPAIDRMLEFPLKEADHDEARHIARAHALDLSRTVFVHPGARLASRRWPAERFAEVARELASRGWSIVITGSRSERNLAEDLVKAAGIPSVNLCGKTSLGALASLLQQGRLLISNDTGISHIAAAVKSPSVVVACGSDVRRWAPLDTERHTVLHAAMACRPCAYDACPLGHGCALAISPQQVLAMATQQLRKEPDRVLRPIAVV